VGVFDGLVLGCEIWTLCQPNAIFDLTPWLDAKVRLIDSYKSQIATVDYATDARGLAATRAFQADPSRRWSGVEAYFALPFKDYRDLVVARYGRAPGA